METTILFVEDNKDLRKNAALVLELEGYKVQVARDGREALDFLDDGMVPDLIVSDIMMPRMDGYEFFEAVRQKAHLKAVPFIFLTARGSRRDVSAGRMLGADDYLVKPFEPEDFLIAVENKLRRTADIRAQAVEGLNDARRLLIQMLSHELRTPLTYVTGGFALLAEELEADRSSNNSDDVRISLDLIQNGTQRLNRLAEQMVLYSQLISGFVTQQIKELGDELELEFLVNDAISLLDRFAQTKDITLQLAYGGGRTAVHGVKDLLVTAISEVIRNAIQYSPEHSAVDVVVEGRDGTARVCVMDRGIGISEKDQAQIWDVLIQSDRDRNEQQGVGMGLPVARGLFEAHGGAVTLRSAPGQGTEVTLELPVYNG